MNNKLDHFIFNTPLTSPYGLTGDDRVEEIWCAMGCFWGAERLFWQAEGIISTSVGYAGGHTATPNYQDVCTGESGHAEVVRIIFDPLKTSLSVLLNIFWENHVPTQGMRQGNDLGSQYRSAIFYQNKIQQEQAESSKSLYQSVLDKSNLGKITTEINSAGKFHIAEEYHQQYLAKNPAGYCGIGGTGLCMPPSLNP